jgi:hypothetical protein
VCFPPDNSDAFIIPDAVPIRIQKQRFATSKFMVQRSQLLDKLVPDTISVPTTPITNQNKINVSTTMKTNKSPNKRKSNTVSNTSTQNQKTHAGQYTTSSVTENTINTQTTAPTIRQATDDTVLKKVNNLEEHLHRITTRLDELQAKNKHPEILDIQGQLKEVNTNNDLMIQKK